MACDGGLLLQCKGFFLKTSCLPVACNLIISIIRQLEIDENSSSPKADEWFPSVLSNYETYVLHAYAIEESEINQTEFLKDYLKQDLHVI